MKGIQSVLSGDRGYRVCFVSMVALIGTAAFFFLSGTRPYGD